MIAPADQWCIQIDVTNACPRRCSNCTHLVGHADTWFMEVDHFRKCVEAVQDFPLESNPASHTKHKLVGIIGGEPLLHPKFRLLAERLESLIPYRHRGLWTSLRWKQTEYANLIDRVFPAYGVHCNLHETTDIHTPVLIAVKEVVGSEVCRQLIDKCWLQHRWASTLTPQGFYCCEVMGCLASVFGQVKGLPVEPGCWRRPLEDFRELIDTLCTRCGVPLNHAGRPASEGVDDISDGNLRDCQGSPKIREGAYEVFDPSKITQATIPWRYKR